MLFFPPYIKFIVWAVFILSGIGLLLMYVLPHGPSAPDKPGGLPLQPTEATILKGTVIDFSSNRNGDIDQMLISGPDKETWVHFPPHTARQVMQLAPKGTHVSAIVSTGPPHRPAPAPGNLSQYQLQQLQAGNEQLSIAYIPPPPPIAGEPVELNGTVDSLITGNRDEVVGFVVSGYRIVLPPHLAQSVAPLLHIHKPILVKGYKRSKNDGFVNTDQHTIIKPFRMTLDSTDYLL